MGGGLASLATAYHLTSSAALRARFEVTVYQRGFRLGGKCASSRREDAFGRIEEHGLHVWMGCYENAFRLIRECYEELGRPRGTPLATWEDAFERHSFISLTERVDDDWRTWRLYFPENDRVPGDGGVALSLGDYARMLPQPLAYVLRSRTVARSLGASRERVLAAILDVVRELPRAIAKADFAKLMPRVQRIRDAFPKLGPGELVRDDLARRFWILLDLVTSIVRGVVADGLVQKGFATIDHLDYRDWLRKHGASTLAVDSPLVRGMYDLALAYEGGDTEKPRMAAGVALRASLRMVGTFKGSVFYKMRAGMGETVITPLYQVLRRRGVRFEFFHDVAEIVPDASGTAIESVTLSRQATLKTPNGTYEPLIDVGKMACWPAEPLYHQLVEGIALRSARVDLESAYGGWSPVGRVSLRAKRDFDVVVLGISVAALHHVAPLLMRAQPAFRAMVENVGTVATQAMQLWLGPSTRELGWRHGATVLSCFAQPFNTWADHTALLATELWPQAHRPASCAYFCGPLRDLRHAPTLGDKAFAERAHEDVRRTAITFLSEHATHLWPQAGAPDEPTRFDWENLNDPRRRRGEARFDAQYVRANVDPSDRYVLSLPGTTRFRLKADQSGFRNLFLAGDWIDTGINVGCVEGAVMGGMQAARAIGGLSLDIPGEVDQLR